MNTEILKKVNETLSANFKEITRANNVKDSNFLMSKTSDFKIYGCYKVNKYYVLMNNGMLFEIN